MLFYEDVLCGHNLSLPCKPDDSKAPGSKGNTKVTLLCDTCDYIHPRKSLCVNFSIFIGKIELWDLCSSSIVSLDPALLS